jgi:phosphate transport system substrate-binding protein
MSLLQRQVGTFFLLALLLFAIPLNAQDTTEIITVGSGVIIPVLETLAANTDSGITLNTTVTGTTSGFSQFCLGQAGIVTASRPITADENSACQDNGVEYAELLVGSSIAAIVASPDVTFAACLSAADLNSLFAPSAAETITNWNQLNPDYPDLPLSAYAPQADTAAFAELDRLVSGDGLRADATYEEGAAILTSVMEGSGSIGAVLLPEAEAGAAQILQVNTNDAVGCQSPSAQAVEDRLYTGGTMLFAYVNRANLETAGLPEFLTVITGPDSAEALLNLGLTPPSDTLYTKNAAAIAGAETGSQFVTDSSTFQISPDVSGFITIAGSPVTQGYLSTVTQAFSTIYPGVSITSTLDGEAAGFRRLCNGETDIAVNYDGLSEEEQANCAANNITTLNIDLGNEVAVLVANANTLYLACLTTEQLATAWSAASASTVTTWNQVDASFPETAMTLFQPTSGSSSTGLLMARSAGTDLPAREDTQVNRDPLYRAAATANVEGALTFMSWLEYQKVLANNQANIQLVSVDAGSGCVAPSEQTVADGSYILARAAHLEVNSAALTRPEVQSLLWYLFMDDNYALFAGNNLSGIPFSTLPVLRENLQQEFSAAVEATAAEVAPEATAEPEATVEPEVTTEPGS